MSNDNASDPPSYQDSEGVAASAGFGHSPQSNLVVSVTADTLNIHASGISALERLSQHNPDVASKLIDATKHAISHESRQYIVGAIAAAIVCCIMLLCMAYIIVYRGLFQGIVFFLVCAAAAAIFSAVFTGTSETLSWTIGLIRKAPRNNNGNERPS
jgi:MFS superfamily sulfate permease-like transporter